MTTAPGPDLDTASADYATRFAGPVGAWFLDVQAAATRRALAGFPRGLTALDVGGGHGQLTPLLQALGFRIAVLGSHIEADAGLRRRGLAGQVSYVVAPLDRLPYADASVDVVLSYRTLAHVEAWSRFLAELCRVARRAVVVDYASSRSVNAMAATLFGAKQRVERNTRPFQLQAPREIARAFESTGFAVTRSVPQFAWPMALHRTLPLTAARLLEAAPRAVGLTRALGSPVVVRADRHG